nr:MAG TPA: hypothetical protein [Caudoviricetes sp.]
MSGCGYTYHCNATLNFHRLVSSCVIAFYFYFFRKWHSRKVYLVQISRPHILYYARIRKRDIK